MAEDDAKAVKLRPKAAGHPPREIPSRSEILSRLMVAVGASLSSPELCIRPEDDDDIEFLAKVRGRHDKRYSGTQPECWSCL